MLAIISLSRGSEASLHPHPHVTNLHLSGPFPLLPSVVWTRITQTTPFWLSNNDLNGPIVINGPPWSRKSQSGGLILKKQAETNNIHCCIQFLSKLTRTCCPWNTRPWQNLPYYLSKMNGIHTTLSNQWKVYMLIQHITIQWLWDSVIKWEHKTSTMRELILSNKGCSISLSLRLHHMSLGMSQRCSVTPYL